MKYIGVLAALVFLLPLTAAADVSSEINFTSTGQFTGKNIVVFQKSGNDLFSRAVWGLAFIRIVLLPNASTTITKAHGEPATVADIQEQDVLDVTGTLVSGADTIMITPTTMRDQNLLSAGKTLTGIVKSTNLSARTFVLTNPSFGNTTVQLTEGAQITKGQRTIFLPDLAIGDKVLSAIGTYDYSGNTFTASSLSVYQDPSVFVARNFQGTLKSIAGTSLPTSVVVTVSGIDYTVFLDAKASILSNAKKNASLSRFVAGDTVRFYGSIRQTNLTQIDSDTLRDLNF